ncbi:hypothetical protein ACWEVP_24755 [Amycolatopsis sp. NPDC003865]
MAGSAVPPTRLAERTRAAVRAVLLAELRSAGTRARAAGCPPETLFEVLDARLGSAAEEVAAESGRRRPGSAGDWPAPACSAPEEAAAESGRRRRNSAAGRIAPARSAAQDREHRRDDPLEPGLVGESGG